MLAIKQAKFKTSNKTQENQIKNTTTDTTYSNTTTSATIVTARRQTDAALNHINNSDGSVNVKYDEVDSRQRRPSHQAPVNSIPIENQLRNVDNQLPQLQTKQQATNATRSEISKIDGATDACAASAKLLLSQPPSPSSSQLPPTTSTESSSPPLAATTAARQSAPTASLINASAKIQQRQQKFLAAAAKSATSPPFHPNQNLMHSKQSAAHIKIACANMSRTSDPTTPATNDSQPRTRATTNKPTLIQQPTVPMSTMSSACCRQAVDCCLFAQSIGSKAATGSGDKSSSYVENAVVDLKRQNQLNNIGCKRQIMPQPQPKTQSTSSPPSKSDTIKGVPRTKVLSMAIIISGSRSSETELGEIYSGVNGAKSSGNKWLSADDDHNRPTMSRASVTSKANNATDALASAPINAESSSSRAVEKALTTGGNAAAIIVDDIERGAVARPLNNASDADKSSNQHQKSCSPSHIEVRQFGGDRQKGNDDNINIKTNTTTTTKHINHNYNHHYYNHNYLNLHQNHQQPPYHNHHHHHNHQNHLHNNHHQQQPQLQTNNLHLQYPQQQAQQSTTQPQQNMMAHYKFHNDCQSSVLTYEQVERLDFVMDQTVPIFGRGASPILYVKLKELIRLVKYKLQHEHSIEIRDVRLNGGAASYVLAPDNSHYNDLDLIFGTDLSKEDRFDVIRDVVLECLMEFYPKAHNDSQQQQGGDYDQTVASSTSFQMPPNNCAIKEAYVHKMVKVNDDDRWSLISLGVQQSETNFNQQQQQQPEAPQASAQQTGVKQQTNVDGCCNQVAGCVDKSSAAMTAHQRGNNGRYPLGKQHHRKQFPNSIELKFVDRMRRKFEFSVDSFQIILDSLIQFYDYAPQSTISIQRRSSSTHPASTMVNTNPLLSHVTCAQCNRGQRVLFDRKTDEDSLVCSSSQRERDNLSSSSKSSKTTQLVSSYSGKKAHKHEGTQRHCETLNASRSFYELPLEQGNSLSNSSVASSSGCSSSSSVVSSSSSSLSCDEDQEDLYRDADNSPSSSASTSSLLSSTTASVVSSTSSPCSLIKSKLIPHNKQQSKKNTTEVSEGQQHNFHLPAEKHPESQTSANDLDDCSQCRDQSGLNNEQIKSSGDNINNGKHHHHHHHYVNTRSLSENLCDFGTSKISSCAVISENFYPTVIGRSEYGNFKEALYHLEKKLIATRSPEEIRGGGLLKYCNLLVKEYKPTNVYQIRTLERYMCSRFFIDFSDLNQQRAKLESYLANHFSDDPKQKFDYLTVLHNVVHRSTVCLMNHELRLTLAMIRDLAYNLNDR